MCIEIDKKGGSCTCGVNACTILDHSTISQATDLHFFCFIKFDVRLLESNKTTLTFPEAKTVQKFVGSKTLLL